MEKAPSSLLCVINALKAFAEVFKTEFKDLMNLQGGDSLVCSSKSVCLWPSPVPGWGGGGKQPHGGGMTQRSPQPVTPCPSPGHAADMHRLCPAIPCTSPLQWHICPSHTVTCLPWHPHSLVPAGGRCTCACMVHLQGKPPVLYN